MKGKTDDLTRAIIGLAMKVHRTLGLVNPVKDSFY